MTQTRALWQVYARHRFGVLFAALLFALVGHPLLGMLVPHEHAVEWLVALTLVAAILGVEAGKGTRPLLALVATFVALRAAAGVIGSPPLFALGQGLWAVALLLMTFLLVRHALQWGPVDTERIFAALGAYLLAATAFGVLYWLLDHNWPASIGPKLDASSAPGTRAT